VFKKKPLFWVFLKTVEIFPLKFLKLVPCVVEPKIVDKRDPSVSNSAWESIFQMNVDFHITASKLGSLNISEYVARYGIETVTEISLLYTN